MRGAPRAVPLRWNFETVLDSLQETDMMSWFPCSGGQGGQAGGVVAQAAAGAGGGSLMQAIAGPAGQPNQPPTNQSNSQINIQVNQLFTLSHTFLISEESYLPLLQPFHQFTSLLVVVFNVNYFMIHSMLMQLNKYRFILFNLVSDQNYLLNSFRLVIFKLEGPIGYYWLAR